MNDTQDIRDELKGSVLEKPVRDQWRVPEGYFDQLPDKLIAKWQKENRASTEYPWPGRRMMAAAAVISAIAFGVTLLTLEQPTRAREITSAEAYDYIHENVSDFEIILEEEIEWSSKSPAVSPEAAEIEQFLMEEMKDNEFESLF